MECDVAVLGGGPGGYPAAIRAAQLGARVVLIEADRIGGTCITVGCIPTKTWVQAAHALKEANHTFAQLGVKVEGATLDFGQAQGNKESIVNGLVNGITGVVKANGITVVQGRGRFKDANTIAVDGGEDVHFGSAVIATGSHSLRPPVDGIDGPRCVDSTGLLEVTELPRRLLVLGGDRKSTRLNSSHPSSSYAVFCLKKTTGFSLSVFSGTFLFAVSGYWSLALQLLDPTIYAFLSIPSIAWFRLSFLLFCFFCPSSSP